MSLYRMMYIFFNDTATTEIYTLSLHDALPIFGLVLRSDESSPATQEVRLAAFGSADGGGRAVLGERDRHRDRKSTRLNSSHANISYAVFCLKKKKPSSL